jgi:hypothetical protein
MVDLNLFLGAITYLCSIRTIIIITQVLCLAELMTVDSASGVHLWSAPIAGHRVIH